MSAEILRRAASLMRERAEAGLASPWQAVEGASGGWWIEQPHTADVVPEVHDRYTAEHIASWHPAVALAVADWLEHVAQAAEKDAADGWQMGARYPGLNVARAYLGESA